MYLTANIGPLGRPIWLTTLLPRLVLQVRGARLARRMSLRNVEVAARSITGLAVVERMSIVFVLDVFGINLSFKVCVSSDNARDGTFMLFNFRPGLHREVISHLLFLFLFLILIYKLTPRIKLK